MNKLFDLWLENKNIENLAKKRRVEIEEEIYRQTGGKSTAQDGYKLTISQSVSRTVDVEKAQEIASEIGNEALLNKVFNWKPSLVKKEFDKLDKTTKDKLSLAITEKYNKPTFKVVKDEKCN